MSQPGRDLYVLEQGRLQALLFPDSDGVPELAHTPPFVVRGVYLGSSELEKDATKSGALLNNKPGLLVGISSPDGPPYRSCLYYTHKGPITASWRDESKIYHGSTLSRYEATTVQGPWQWLSECAAGQQGYFITGDAERNSLWRVFRLEADPFSRCLFTLAPVRFTSRLPSVDFSVLGVIAIELLGQYEELCRAAIQGAYRDVVTKARNIVEGILATKFEVESRDRLNDSLKHMKILLGRRASREAALIWNTTLRRRFASRTPAPMRRQDDH